MSSTLQVSNNNNREKVKYSNKVKGNVFIKWYDDQGEHIQELHNQITTSFINLLTSYAQVGGRLVGNPVFTILAYSGNNAVASANASLIYTVAGENNILRFETVLQYSSGTTITSLQLQFSNLPIGSIIASVNVSSFPTSGLVFVTWLVTVQINTFDAFTPYLLACLFNVTSVPNGATTNVTLGIQAFIQYRYLTSPPSYYVSYTVGSSATTIPVQPTITNNSISVTYTVITNQVSTVFQPTVYATATNGNVTMLSYLGSLLLLLGESLSISYSVVYEAVSGG